MQRLRHSFQLRYHLRHRPHPPSQASLADHHHRRNHRHPNPSNERRRYQGPLPQILPLEHMTTSATASTNVQSVLTKSHDSQRYGHVRLVGLSSILVVSSVGQRMKARLFDLLLARPMTRLTASNGAVQVVTFPRMSHLRLIPAGARRNLIQHRYLDYHHTHVDRLADGRGSSPRAALILAISYVMLDRALPAQPWVRSSTASVAKKKRRGDVSRPITYKAGAVAPFAET
jgi:hypothetical protein